MTGYFALIMSYSVLYDKIALLFVQNTLAGLVEYQVLPFGLSLAPPGSVWPSVIPALLPVGRYRMGR